MPLDTFRDFSGRWQLPLDHFDQPGLLRQTDTSGNLAELVRAVQDAQSSTGSAHAMGSAWAFSAPAYCPGVVIRTEKLGGFPVPLQLAINAWDQGSRLLVAVEAGIKVRDLSLALMGRDRRLFHAPGSPHLPAAPGFTAARTLLAPPTLGGAGGQSLAGVVSTGTHGGDVARPPLSDYVHAMLIVGSAGEVRLMQRAPADARAYWPGLPPGTPLVDVGRLSAALTGADHGIAIHDVQDTLAFESAVVSVGRFGVVYAYVFEVHDETGTFVYEFREESVWSQVKEDLLHNNIVQDAAAHDGFLQVVINPTPQLSGDHKCYVTKHRMAPDDPIVVRDGMHQTTRDIGRPLFGLGGAQELPAIDVNEARAGPLPPEVGQIFCVDHPTIVTEVLAGALTLLGIEISLAFPILGAIAAVPIFEAAHSVAEIGPDHLLGDVMADVLNLATNVGLPQITEMAIGAVLDGAQGGHIGDGPWLVFGTRGDIADFFDYDHPNCYKGDSIEMFFPADENLPDVVESIFGVFQDIRRSGVAMGAYISLRFMARTSALLGMAAFSPTCSIEISMLRGLEGNDRALSELQTLTLRQAPNSRLHWGQENDLLAGQVVRVWGAAVGMFRSKLAELEGGSTTFRNQFSQSHGLEPDTPALWTHWEDLNFAAGGSPAVISAGFGKPLQVFAVDAHQNLSSKTRTGAGGSSAWTSVKPDPSPLRATPAVVRSVDGRTELFIRAPNGTLRHIYQQGNGVFSDWDTLGGPTTISGDPTVTPHADGRLEAFAMEGRATHRMLHTCADWVNGPWGGLDVWGNQLIGAQPTCCLRRHTDGATVSDQLVAVSTDGSGVVVWKAQIGPGGDSGWTDWAPVRAPGGATLAAPGAGPTVVTPRGGGARVLAVDAGGQVHEAVDSNRTLALGWQAWQALPALPPANVLSSSIPLSTVQAADRLWLFGVSRNGSAMAIALTAAGWQNWVNLGGNISSLLAGGVLDDGRVEVMGLNTSGSELMARRQTAVNVWT